MNQTNKNAHYWNKKEQKSIAAHNHTVEMQQMYEDEIDDAIRRSMIFDTDFYHYVPLQKSKMQVNLADCDSVSAVLDARKRYESNIGVLNFASYKNPGGMFLAGSIAQEECLCHESFLYNVLSDSDFADYYAWNNEHKNKALYLNRAIWTPDVRFVRGEDSAKCDVVTCAAPNIGAAKQYCNVSNAENTKVLRDRIRYVLDIFEYQNVNVPILGAWGAGVFGQDATEVATLFKEALESGRYSFDTVVFAILPGPNFDAFADVFEGGNKDA